jgi:hypothetical protein
MKAFYDEFGKHSIRVLRTYLSNNRGGNYSSKNEQLGLLTFGESAFEIGPYYICIVDPIFACFADAIAARIMLTPIPQPRSRI